MIIRVGSCAWSFEDWKGPFYPEHFPHGEWLAYYASHFDTVEVDSTFYHVPTKHAVEGWMERTPDDFRFCLKLPRTITHELPLHEAGRELSVFLKAIEPLAPKVQAVLAQFPMGFRANEQHRAFWHFVTEFPKDWRLAVELRHESWLEPRFIRLLEDHKVALVWADYDPVGGSAAFQRHPVTTDFLYVRLLGDSATKYGSDGAQKQVYRSLQWPRDWEMTLWKSRIEAVTKARSAMVFANNHYEGFAPETIGRLAALFRLPKRVLPPEWGFRRHEDPKQPDLWTAPPDGGKGIS